MVWPDVDLAARLVDRLRRLDLTLATCESLTGGLLGATITAVAGSSAVYRGGLITYATDLKHDLAGVARGVLAAEGVVSAATACGLASGAASRCGADVALALTGVAGPMEQDGKPAGTVWLGLRRPGVATRAELLPIGAAAVTAGREAVRVRAVDLAIERLLTALE